MNISTTPAKSRVPLHFLHDIRDGDIPVYPVRKSKFNEFIAFMAACLLNNETCVLMIRSHHWPRTARSYLLEKRAYTNSLYAYLVSPSTDNQLCIPVVSLEHIRYLADRIRRFSAEHDGPIQMFCDADFLSYLCNPPQPTVNKPKGTVE